MRTGTMLAAMLVAVLTLHTVQAAAADCGDMEARIAAAKTAADHEAIAVCYDDMAKDAQAKATEHKQMAAAYRKAGGIGAIKGLNMPQHCDYFIKTYQNEAKTYEQMAAAHRQMAKKTK